VNATFIERSSCVRAIWGDPDLVLLIFAGAAAEFALNRAVDWLFYTNNLPSDPIGRLFSTVHYAQQVVFASPAQAHRALDSISAVHAAVERRRGQRIPDWAYRDVLYMLIDYSARAHRLLRGPLNSAQEESLYSGFLQIGHGLHIPELPESFAKWQQDRQTHLDRDLVYSDYTERLMQAYRAQLGGWRYQLLLEIQALLTPARVRALLQLKPKRLLVGSGLLAYSAIEHTGLRSFVLKALIPYEYWRNLHDLGAVPIKHLQDWTS
jgi:hypothetical protein